MIKEIFTKFIAVFILATFVLGAAPIVFAQKMNVGKDAQKFIDEYTATWSKLR